MSSEPRYAIYYVPEPDSPLWHFGSRLLAYDSYTGAQVPPFDALADAHMPWQRWISRPRRYGFHATLKAPFRLAPNYEVSDLLGKVRSLARSLHSFSLGELAPQVLDQHLVLRPRTEPAALKLLEASLVTRLDRFRAPLGNFDRQRRSPNSLTTRQLANLDQWGYPFCLDEFRFHMTLAGPVDTAQQIEALATLEEIYQDFAGPCFVTSIAVLCERTPGAPFQVIETLPLGAPASFGVLNSCFVLSHR